MSGTTVSVVQTVLEAVTADHDRRLTESTGQTNRFATAANEMAKAQNSAQAQVAKLTREIALAGDKSRLAAVQYDITKGALQGVDAATKTFLVTLARQVDLQKAEARSAGEAARAQGLHTRAMETATQVARGFSGALGTIASGGVIFALASFAKTALDADVKMDSLRRGLISVSGSAEIADAELKRLEESAKLPGLASRRRLRDRYAFRRRASQPTPRAVRWKGSAPRLPRWGRAKPTLTGVTLALSQIASKGKVSAEEINQLAERVPQIRVIMQEAFGTADTEVLQKAKIGSQQFIEEITERAHAHAKVMAGIRDDLDNTADTAERAMARIGKALDPVLSKLLRFAAPNLERMGKAVSGAVDASRTQNLIESTLTGKASPDPKNEFSEGFGISEQLKILTKAKSDFAGQNMIGKFFGPSDEQLKRLDTYVSRLNGVLQKRKDTAASAMQREIGEGQAEVFLGEFGGINAPGLANTQGMIAKAGQAAEAARKKAEADAERARKKAEADAKRHAEALRQINQDTADSLFRLTHNQFEVERREADRERVRNVKNGADRVLQQANFAARIADINKREREAHVEQIARELKDDFAAEEKRVAARKKALADMLQAQYDFVDMIHDIEERSPLLPRDMTEGMASAMGTADAFAKAPGVFGPRNTNTSVPGIGARRTAGQDADAFVQQLNQSARASSGTFLRNLLSFRGNNGQALQTFYRQLQDGFLNAITSSAGTHLVKPLLDQLQTGLMDAVTKSIRVAHVSIQGILSDIYALLAVSQRKKKIGVLSVLGGIAGGVFGGFGGAIAGYNAGNALDNGDIGGAAIAGVAGYAGGAFGGGAKPETFGPPSPHRSILIDHSGPTFVNEKADVQRVSLATAQRLQLAMQSRTG
jgi:tape measure domain-containing protein